MRFWLSLILTLSFAVQGWALTSASALGAPCPMEAEMVMALAQEGGAMPIGEEGATPGDCCNDMATFVLTGQACKTGQDCQAPAFVWCLPASSPVAAGLSQAVPVAHPPMGLSALPVAVWRPPTFFS